MAAGERLEFLDAFKLPLVRPGIREGLAIHHLHCAERPHDVARQPHFAIGPAADAAEQLVVRDHWWRPGAALLICCRGVLWHVGTFTTSRARGKANSISITRLVVPSNECLV